MKQTKNITRKQMAVSVWKAFKSTESEPDKNDYLFLSIMAESLEELKEDYDWSIKALSAMRWNTWTLNLTR